MRDVRNQRSMALKRIDSGSCESPWVSFSHRTQPGLRRRIRQEMESQTPLVVPLCIEMSTLAYRGRVGVSSSSHHEEHSHTTHPRHYLPFPLTERVRRHYHSKRQAVLEVQRQCLKACRRGALRREQKRIGAISRAVTAFSTCMHEITGSDRGSERSIGN